MSEPRASAQGASSVCAVVVTHNRCELLHRCLQAVLGQDRPPDRVLVVDVASTDATPELLAGTDGIEVLRLAENVGGAGGFRAGMAAAHEAGSDWLWLMDDDTVPTSSALRVLLEAEHRLEGLPAPDILASRVVWIDGRLHPKNLPAPRLEEPRNEVFIEAVARGLLPIRLASFVSILVRREAIDRCGLPDARYFMWGDDGEYTARVLHEGDGYTVPASVVHHHTAALEPVHHDSSGRYFYEVRNKLWQIRSGSFTGREKLGLVAATAVGISMNLRHNRFSPQSLRTVARGIREGLR